MLISAEFHESRIKKSTYINCALPTYVSFARNLYSIVVNIKGVKKREFIATFPGKFSASRSNEVFLNC